MVIDNAEIYVAVKRLISHKYKHINWTYFVAHCLNLFFKNIYKLDHIVEFARCALKVTVFVYNHVALLNWLRKKMMDRDSSTLCNSLCYYMNCIEEPS